MKKDFKNKFLPVYSLELPEDLKREMKKAKKLEIITLIYVFTEVLVLFFVMSSSQAMKAAWTEDLFALIPSFSFLVSLHFYDRKANYRFPYGFHRVFSIGFAFGAFALLGIGIYISLDSVIALIKAEHPTIPHKEIFGQQVWLGWIMIIALIYTLVPPVILGRKKIPVARKLHNKLLYTDADAQRADWKTAAAAILGITGIGFGFWWADPVAALFISVSIVKDGIIRSRSAIVDLLGEIPTKTGSDELSEINERIIDLFLMKEWIRDVRIRLREEGQVFTGEAFVIPGSENNLLENIARIYSEVKKLDWKVHELTIQPVKDFDFGRKKEEEKEMNGPA